MNSPITRRSALGLAALAVPCMSAILNVEPAQAQTISPASAKLAADTTSTDGDADVTEVVYSGVSLAVRGKDHSSGWSSWGASSAVGSKKGAGLVSLQIKLKGLQGLTGHVSYQVFKRGSGWQSVAADGKSTSVARNIEAVKIKLSGDVAAHYDVRYRTYMRGRGWGKWVRNGAKSGITGKRTRVNAIQVSLSPKTEEAAGNTTSKVGVRYAVYVRKTGWQALMGDGEIAGTVGKSRALGGFSVVADAGSRSGSVTYRAHVSGKGWGKWKSVGQFAGSAAHNLEAVSIKLTGSLASKYNVYYCAHVAGYGWLDWAKNGATAGSTGFGAKVEALRIVLVKKGSSGPGRTSYPTVNKLEKSKRLNGIDISSWQPDIKISAVPGQFVIVKATQGNWYTNPYFKKHANATLSCGKLLGCYHFADLRGSAKAQANYFVKRVKPYIGQCILVLDWEEDALNLGPAWAKKFLDQVYKKTGVKPLIYMSQTKTYEYNWSSVSKKYKLWVAQYLYRNMNTGYLSKPEGGTDIGYWSAPTIYQYSSSGQLRGYGSSLDLNKFYGSATIWKRLCTGY